MNHLSLFSGVGGIDLAAERAGMETVAFCEREAFPQKVLRKHWPDTPIYDDVCKLTKERLLQDGIIGPGRAIDIISAGYPCQPFSNAGKRRGKEDERHLWPEVARLLSEIRPRWFLGENVAGHISMGLDDVLDDLESIGYTAQAIVIPTCAVGAPHRRDRVFILGYTERSGCSGESRRRSKLVSKDGHFELEKGDVADTAGPRLSQWGQSGLATTGSEAESRVEPESERCGEILADTPSERGGGLSIFARGSQQAYADPDGCSSEGSKRSIESRLGRELNGLSDWLDGYKWPAAQGQAQYDWEPPRVATGVKDRVGRLKALGNAVNPVQVFPILSAIKAIDDYLSSSKEGRA